MLAPCFSQVSAARQIQSRVSITTIRPDDDVSILKLAFFVQDGSLSFGAASLGERVLPPLGQRRPARARHPRFGHARPAGPDRRVRGEQNWRGAPRHGEGRSCKVRAYGSFGVNARVLGFGSLYDGSNVQFLGFVSPINGSQMGMWSSPDARGARLSLSLSMLSESAIVA